MSEEQLLADLIIEHYEKIRSLLVNLLEYKQFHQTEIAAVDMEAMIASTEKTIVFMEELAKKETDDEKNEYLKEIAPEYQKLLEDQNTILSKNIENLGKIVVPENILDKRILEDRLVLRIKTYEAIKKNNEEKIKNIQNSEKLSEIFSGNMELDLLKIEMDKNLLKYKSNSEIARIFQSVISNDAKIKEKALSLEKGLSLDLGKDDIYLEDLLAKFYRNENSEIQKRIDAIKNTAIQGSNEKNSIYKEFEIKSGYSNLSALFSFNVAPDFDTDKINCYLKSPSGKIIDKEKINETKGARFSSSWSYQLFSIENPEAGAWKAIVEDSFGQRIDVLVSDSK